jgi:D-alanyl-D-alanine carboxypeptidase
MMQLSSKKPIATVMRKVTIQLVTFIVFATACMTTAVHAASYAGIVIDAKTGKVLYSQDPDGRRYPASLTKMMTLYLVFEALESGRISLSTKVPVSAHAASEPPSKIGVRAGGSFTVEQGILSLVTRSANDAATALGEFVGGSESNFARMMTAKARALGMTRTVYRNANGLPDSAQVTTARDQARLGIALRQHFPQYYGYFSTRSFKFGKQVIGNHNRLLGVVRGVDGIKTGFTNAAGFNLVTSAQLDGRSIVGVVLGGKTGGQRDAQMKALVMKYMPMASRKSGQAYAVSAPPVVSADEPEVAVSATVQSGASNSVELPHVGPMPSARYTVEEIAEAISPKAPEMAMVEAKEPADPTQLITAPSNVAIPQPAPEYVPELASAEQAQPVDDVTTASTKPASEGWVIQIGAAPSKDLAMKLLQKAQDSGGKVLRSATPFTVAFTKGNAQLYRARFGGFGNQDKAVTACKTLKSKGFGCWASLQ